jgi:anti-anti-sigma factor
MAELLIAVRGDYDYANAKDLRQLLNDAVAANPGHLICLDLSETGLLDSVALGGLIAAYKRARATGGSIVIASASRPVRNLLSTTGLDRVFERPT